MRNRLLMLGGIAVLIVGVAVFAVGRALPRLHGQERSEAMPRKHLPGPEMVDHMARALNLTEAQQTQIKSIFESARAASEPLHTKLEEVHKQLEAATANGQFDEAQVRALANQQAQIMADTIVEHERTKSKIYAILTPEQRVKADELHKQGFGRHRRHGPGH